MGTIKYVIIIKKEVYIIMEINTKDELFEFLSSIEERVTSIEQAQKSMYDEQQTSNNDNPQEEQPTDENNEQSENGNNDNSENNSDNENNEEQNLDELEKLLGF
jgi:hypothetical protein